MVRQYGTSLGLFSLHVGSSKPCQSAQTRKYIYSRKMIKICKQLYSETLLNCCLVLFQCHADIDQVACVLLVGQSPQSIAGPGRRCCGTVMVGSFAVVV